MMSAPVLSIFERRAPVKEIWRVVGDGLLNVACEMQIIRNKCVIRGQFWDQIVGLCTNNQPLRWVWKTLEVKKKEEQEQVGTFNF